MFLLAGLAINSISKTNGSKTKSDRRRNRKSQDIKEKYIKKINDNEIKEIVYKLLNDYKSSYDLCINSLILFPNYRNQEVIDLIKPYLKELIGLMDIISKEKNEELSEKTLTQVALNLKYKKILKNKFICKYGEKGNHFYVILKGKVVFLVPKIIKCYLNEIEYFTYLLKLKKVGENELLKNCLILNRQFYDLGDDFDYYIRELIDDYKTNDKKHSSFITQEIYATLLKIVEEEDKIIKEVNDNDNEINHENKSEENNELILNLEEYIERSKVNDMNLNNKDRKKVNVFMYQITNYYEDGQIFGNVALESKFGKRTATAISLEDCELGLLTKEQYNSTLSSIHAKSLEILFNTINSYNILGVAPKKAFDNRFCHMFKFIRFKRGAKIMEENKKINSVIVFNVGQFTLTLNKNLLELNELVGKLHKIRGKMMGLNENSIKKDLSNNYEKDLSANQKFILPETMKLYQKKHNLTISIVNDKLVIGLLDTIDPDTNLPLFNCTCISKVCDGYEITNKSLNLVNKEYPCLNNSNQISLINIEYYLKRIQLHMKEIESKIENFNKNLKYDIKKNSKLKNIKNNKNENNEVDEESGNNKNEDENDDFEIRRNTFEIKKKNNNEISLVQILGKSLKNDYSTSKKQRYETIDKTINNDSINLNSENKRYENIKTIKDEGNEELKVKNLSFIYKVKRSIKEKEQLLRLAQGKSQKYMEIKKAEIRSINMARNKKFQKDKYIDLSEIFNKNKNSKEKKNPYEILFNKQDKKKDYILDNIINDIKKKGKYERILSSLIYKKRNNETINENEEEKKYEENVNKKDEKNIIKKNESIDNLSDKKHRKYLTIEENKKISSNNKSIQINKKNKGIKYPLIKSNLRILLNNNRKEDSDHFFESRNIITLNGLNSLGEQSLSHSKSNKKIFKRYNKIMNDNSQKSKNLFQLNKINNLIANKVNTYENNENKNNKLSNIISIYDNDKVHFFDPLVLDKFNSNFIH